MKPKAREVTFNTDSLAKTQDCFYIILFLLLMPWSNQLTVRSRPSHSMSLHTFACNLDKLFIVCRVVNIRLQDIAQLKQYCLNLFRACLFTNFISPTIWCMGHVIPAHAMDVFNKYELGLNCVSMEERESKHITIGRYSQNTDFSERWGQIFSYEFVKLIWLREKRFYEEENLQHRQTSPKG